MFKEKYLKYKQKYLELKGGSKKEQGFKELTESFNIYNNIRNENPNLSSGEDIQDVIDETNSSQHKGIVLILTELDNLNEQVFKYNNYIIRIYQLLKQNNPNEKIHIKDIKELKNISKVLFNNNA